MTLLERAIGRVGGYPEGHRGVPVGEVVARMREHVAAVRDGTLVPGEDATFAPPPV